jgi:hypothetical protein
MSLTREDILVVGVIAGFVAILWIAKRFSRPPMALMAWAREQGCAIVRATYREYAYGPFEKAGIRKQQDIYQITVRTAGGNERGAWVRCNYGRAAERVEVAWDAPANEPAARWQIEADGSAARGDGSLLELLSKDGMVRERFPSKDALVAFVPAGEKPAPEVAEQIRLRAEVRWHPVAGGCLVKIPFGPGPVPAGLFRTETGGWGYGRCDGCGANVAADEESWLTVSGPFHRLCDECHRKLPGAGTDTCAPRSRGSGLRVLSA